MKLIEFVFQSFWHFTGFAILFGMCLRVAFLFWNRALRHLNMRKNGYPPAHCDADGDICNFESEEESD